MTGQPATGGSLAAISSVVSADGPAGTDLLVSTACPDGLPGGQLTIRIRRILQPDADGDTAGHPCLYGTWRQPDGSQARGIFATARYSQVPAPRP